MKSSDFKSFQMIKQQIHIISNTFKWVQMIVNDVNWFQVSSNDFKVFLMISCDFERVQINSSAFTPWHEASAQKEKPCMYKTRQ